MSTKSETLPKGELDKQLDCALRNTFPASDAVSVGEPTSTEPDRPVDRRPAEIDAELVDALAEEVAEKQKSKGERPPPR